MLHPESWLKQWTAQLLKRHPNIEQVYLLGDKARGPFGQKPNYSLLFYAGYNGALDLLMALAREEDKHRPDDGILHLYVENYGATFCGIWGGALIPNELNHDWIEKTDYQLWLEVASGSRPLSERLRLPEERRQDNRRLDAVTDYLQLGAAWADDETNPMPSDAFPDGEERRERQDRRRDVWELMPLLGD